MTQRVDPPPKWWAFYHDNARWLAAGVLLAFGSALGQTWFISLFAADIRSVHGLSDGGWGLVYMAATLTSALLLSRAGALVDHLALAPLAVGLVTMLVLASAGLAFSTSLLALFLSVLGLRFAGQGMMSHTALTAMGRAFAANRGKAVAFAILGFPLAEAALPPLVASAKLHLSWQTVLIGASMVMAALLIPALLWSLSKPRAPKGEGSHDSFVGLGHRHWHRQEVLAHPLFWLLIPVVLTPPFIGTVVFFHQSHIADVKDWPLTMMALGITLYAAVSVLTGLISGWLVDRVGLSRLLPGLLVPMGAGMGVLTLPDAAVWQWFAVLALCGMTQGMGSTIYGALWPMLYGTRHIGAIRAIISAAMVFATAAGPGLTGLVIDLGVPFPAQAGMLALLCWALCLPATLAARSITRQRRARARSDQRETLSG